MIKKNIFILTITLTTIASTSEVQYETISAVKYEKINGIDRYTFIKPNTSLHSWIEHQTINGTTTYTYFDHNDQSYYKTTRINQGILNGDIYGIIKMPNNTLINIKDPLDLYITAQESFSELTNTIKNTKKPINANNIKYTRRKTC